MRELLVAVGAVLVDIRTGVHDAGQAGETDAKTSEEEARDAGESVSIRPFILS